VTVLVSLDGRIVPPEAAEVSVFDRGFLYGDAVSAAWRTHGGVPFALDEHLAELERSATLVALPSLDFGRLREEIVAVVRATGNAETYVRVILTRGTGATLGLDPALARTPLRVVLAMELPATPAWFYERGIGVVTLATGRSAGGTRVVGSLAGVGLSSVLALREAERRGADDALILNADGEVLEGTSSNVFLVIEGALVTPPEEAGIVAGVTRALVLELASRLALDVTLRTFAPSVLGAAEEAFLTSDLREIVPIVALDGRPAGGGRPGPVTRRLLAAYRALTLER
jgi:branched-chain amino acid aminotransferase